MGIRRFNGTRARNSSNEATKVVTRGVVHEVTLKLRGLGTIANKMFKKCSKKKCTNSSNQGAAGLRVSRESGADINAEVFAF